MKLNEMVSTKKSITIHPSDKIENLTELNKLYSNLKPTDKIDNITIGIDHEEFHEFNSLKGAPKKISGNLSLTNCINLQSMEYCPIAKEIFINNCGIKNLKGIPNVPYEGLYLDGDHELESFAGIPTNIEIILLTNCINVKNLKHLWDVRCVHIEFYIHHKAINPKLQEAADIICHYKAIHNNNYLKLMREAREKGLEEFFK